MSDNISVLLVDDHTLVRRGFRRMLEDEPISKWRRSQQRRRCRATGARAASGRDCDGLRVPAMSGLVAARLILAESPEQAILMLSMHRKTRWCARRLTPVRADTS